MPDEIDLLRLFRDDTPGPDDAAWEKARSAIEMINEPVAADHHDHRRLRRRRILVISAVAVASGVAAGFLPGWRGWATWLRGTAILMMALLAAFGFAMATHHGPAGLFEKAATIIVTIAGTALITRVLARAGRLTR
jgi:hypothetical protein